MFHRYGKKEKSACAKPPKDLTDIVPPAQLLSELKRKELLQKITAACSFEASRFDGLCLTLINHLIEYCQRLPETSNSYYALPGGMLDHALNRTEAALSLFRDYVMQGEGARLSEEQELWLYALFSAGILQGIGKLQIDYCVDLFDADGQLLKPWSPLLESMASEGSLYHFEFLPEGDHALRCRLNILLARLLMPASGFAWIISNPQVLAVWLALLSEDARSSGTLGAILHRAKAISIQRYFNEWMIRGIGHRGNRGERIGTFVDKLPESVTDKERIIGIKFLKWLTMKLESSQLLINKAPLLMVSGGLLMTGEIFKWFVREHPEYKNWQAAQKAFLSLGLHKKGMGGGAMSRFEQTKTQQMHSGVVFSEYAVVLPKEVSFYHTHTGAVSRVSATELVHMGPFDHLYTHPKDSRGPVMSLQCLSVSGEWQFRDTNPAHLRSGNPRSV